MLLLMLGACGSQYGDRRKLVGEWVGRTLIIPDELIFKIGDIAIDPDTDNADYRIVSYVDSTGCTSCRLKLQLWNKLIGEFKAIDTADIDFLTIINTSNEREISYLLKRDDFLHEVSIDRDNLFDQVNRLPEDHEYHTFLLDSDNRILAIGNPVNNPKIKELYKRIVTGRLQGDELQVSSSVQLCKNNTKPLGVIGINDTVTVSFEIDNQDSVAYSIQDMIPSCDCTVAMSSDSVILPGEKITISIEYLTDSIPGRFSRYVDVYFNEKEDPERLIIYGVVM